MIVRYRARAVLVLSLLVHPVFAHAQQDDMRPARTKGSASAPVTIFEMGDFQCPVCGQFFRQTMPALDREYVATGKVRIVFVNFPLPMHPNAEPAAELAMCAARQNLFWPMHDVLYRTQEQWSDLREPGTFFIGLGDSVRADRDQLAACLRTGSVRDLVRKDAEGAVRSGATGTPNFWIEGGLIRGTLSIREFRPILDSIIRTKAGR